MLIQIQQESWNPRICEVYSYCSNPHIFRLQAPIHPWSSTCIDTMPRISSVQKMIRTQRFPSEFPESKGIAEPCFPSRMRGTYRKYIELLGRYETIDSPDFPLFCMLQKSFNSQHCINMLWNCICKNAPREQIHYYTDEFILIPNSRIGDITHPNWIWCDLRILVVQPVLKIFPWKWLLVMS